MILLDYSQIALSNIIVQKLNDENMIRHMILNSIRMYNKKYRNDYGQMVICADGMNTWRKEFYPQYKASRKKGRDSSGLDWQEIFRVLNLVRDEIKENLPYKVLHMEGCEADDIIGALTYETQEFGKFEPVMIISSDKDFIQLQSHGHVIQWSPMFNKMIKEENPRRYLFEHLLKGDSGDGVPNANSHDDVFVTAARQTPMTKKAIDKYWDNRDDLESIMKPNVYRNFMRNVQMIDLENTPQEMAGEIYIDYLEYQYPPRTNILTYLVENRMKMLIECANEF